MSEEHTGFFLPSKLILVLIETFVSDKNVKYKIKHFTVIKVHF